MAKRIIDMVLSVIGLLVATPIMLLIAAAIRLESPGPVIFSQPRLGYKGKPFRVHKFRKFPSDWGVSGSGVTVAGDARMTRVGAFIERTKLDELPQFWNILKGEMSFVGPRPESLAYADLFKGEYAVLLNYVPGIFGPNQVEFRNEAEMYPADQDPDEFYRTVLFPKKAQKDLEYFSASGWLSELFWVVRGVWVSVLHIFNWRRLFFLHGSTVLLDIMAIEGAWMAANLIYFGMSAERQFFEGFKQGMLVLPIATVLAMALTGVYRRHPRYFSESDIPRMITVVSVAWIAVSLLLLDSFQKNILLALAPFSLLIVLPIISMVRIWRREAWLKFIKSAHVGHKNKIVIYGGGLRAVTIASFVEQGFPGSRLMGIIDDRDEMRGRYFFKHKVLGCARDLETLHRIHKFEQLWMSFMPSKDKYYQIIDWCEEHAIKLVVLPNVEPFSTLQEQPEHMHYEKRRIGKSRRNSKITHIKEYRATHSHKEESEPARLGSTKELL